MIKNQSILKHKNHETDFDKKRKDLLKKSEFSLWLDSYDDIFSDFDPRPNSQRALSQDFLDESKRATRYTKFGSMQLNLLINEKARDLNEEEIVKKRLHEHFQKHHLMQIKERKKIIRKGLLFISIGLILLFLATYILVTFGDNTYFISFLLIILEPSGWFFSWEGLNIAIFTSKEQTSDFEFYKKMSNCEINFVSE